MERTWGNPESMEIEFLNESNREQWDEFAFASDSAWMRHTTAWQKYSSCCRFDSNTRNFSFMVKQGGKIQAIVPLLAEYSYPERTVDCFAMYGDYTPLPAFVENGEVSVLKRALILSGTVTSDGVVTLTEFQEKEVPEIVLSDYEMIDKSELPFSEEEYKKVIDAR